MLPLNTSMSSPPHDVRNVSDDRIHPEETRHHLNSSGAYQIRSTPEGDVVVVQPSFDDSMGRSKTPERSPVKSSLDWQARSPDEDGKQGDTEPRSPSSPSKPDNPLSARHERQLSAHFFDATTLTSRDDVLDDDPAIESSFDDKVAGRKHRRMFSGDLTNPNMAHRRINSIGRAATVQRSAPVPSRHHHREGSAGLDMLSAAVTGVAKEDLAAVVGTQVPQGNPTQPPMNIQHSRLPSTLR